MNWAANWSELGWQCHSVYQLHPALNLAPKVTLLIGEN